MIDLTGTVRNYVKVFFRENPPDSYKRYKQSIVVEVTDQERKIKNGTFFRDHHYSTYYVRPNILSKYKEVNVQMMASQI